MSDYREHIEGLAATLDQFPHLSQQAQALRAMLALIGEHEDVGKYGKEHGDPEREKLVRALAEADKALGEAYKAWGKAYRALDETYRASDEAYEALRQYDKEHGNE